MPTAGVDGDGVAIEGVEKDPVIGIHSPAVDHIAAGHSLRRRSGFRLVLPLHRARLLLQIEGVENIASAIEQALSEAVYGNHIVQRGLFFSPIEQPLVPIRNRADVSSRNLRKPDYMPPAEIRQALSEVVRVHLGMTAGEAATEVARLFGFKSTSAQLKQIVQDEVEYLIEQNVFTQRNGKLYVNESEPAAKTF